MASFIIDASAALAWCFEDETAQWSEALLARVRAGDHLIVPAHWLLEITNALLVAVRKKRIELSKAFAFLDDLQLISISCEPSPDSNASREIFSLARKHEMTSYDAAYLELALAQRLPLATLDIRLRSACQAEGVTLL